MSNFLEDIAYRQYENKLPERYDEEPLFHCCSCGDDIFEGEQIVVIDDSASGSYIAMVSYDDQI